MRVMVIVKATKSSEANQLPSNELLTAFRARDLTGIDVLAMYIDGIFLGNERCVVVAMAIAVVKSSLVVLFFMHLWDHGGANRLVLATTVVFVALLMGLVLLGGAALVGVGFSAVALYASASFGRESVASWVIVAVSVWPSPSTAFTLAISSPRCTLTTWPRS